MKRGLPQLDTPLRLGYCAEVVDDALLDVFALALELSVTLALRVVDPELDGTETVGGASVGLFGSSCEAQAKPAPSRRDKGSKKDFISVQS